MEKWRKPCEILCLEFWKANRMFEVSIFVAMTIDGMALWIFNESTSPLLEKSVLCKSNHRSPLEKPDLLKKTMNMLFGSKTGARVGPYAVFGLQEISYSNILYKKGIWRYNLTFPKNKFNTFCFIFFDRKRIIIINFDLVHSDSSNCHQIFWQILFHKFIFKH